MTIRLQQFIIFLLPLVSGCTTQLTQDQRYIATPLIDKSHPRATLITASGELANSIRLLNPIFKKIGKYTKAQVSVQNLSQDRYTLEYKFTWKDEQGFSTGQSVWQRFTLDAGLSDNFFSVGKTAEAKTIVFTVRLPDDHFIDLERQQSNY